MADQGRDAAASAPSATGKRRRSVERGDEQEEMKTNQAQVEVTTFEQQEGGNRPADEEEERAEAPMASIAVAKEAAGGGDEEESDSEEEDTLVVLELCDFKNHPLLDDYSSATLEGIDTATPMLRIGEYVLHGQLEETVGTSYFYDTDTSRVPDKTYQFAGQTIKRIKFTIAPPEDS